MGSYAARKFKLGLLSLLILEFWQFQSEMQAAKLLPHPSCSMNLTFFTPFPIPHSNVYFDWKESDCELPIPNKNKLLSIALIYSGNEIWHGAAPSVGDWRIFWLSLQALRPALPPLHLKIPAPRPVGMTLLRSGGRAGARCSVKDESSC